MKNNSLLSVLLLAVLATGASASPIESDPIALPTYVVEVDRDLSAEQHVNRSLAALRAEAGKPVNISVELPALRVNVAHVARHLAATRLAQS